MAVTVEIKGLDEIQRRMQNSPQVFDRALRRTMDAALLIVWEKIPGYPPQPEGSAYVRTGTLGRSIGVGKQSKPDIYEVKKDGMYQAGRIGTRLKYAPYVIGERTQARWMRHWWTLDGTVLQSALPKIQEAFQVMARALADYIAKGKGV